MKPDRAVLAGAWTKCSSTPCQFQPVMPRSGWLTQMPSIPLPETSATRSVGMPLAPIPAAKSHRARRSPAATISPAASRADSASSSARPYTFGESIFPLYRRDHPGSIVRRRLGATGDDHRRAGVG